MVNNVKKAISFLMSMMMCLAVLAVFPKNMMNSYADFTMRTSAPLSSDARYYGSNPFYKSGYGMPNCTCYAYGRAWEILGSQPNLPTGNAGSWWWTNMSTKAYPYGSTPKLGAIACWDKNDKNKGHVAVVESISGNRVTLSESHYNGIIFDNKTMNADGSDYLTSFRFLGYIYIGDFISSSFPGEEDSSYSIPISVTASKKINTYDGNGNPESNRWIDAGDACTIDKVYKNGFVHVGYPTSSGTRWAYAKKDDFDLTPSSHSPNGVVDSSSGGAGTVSVSGWGFDPDNIGATIDVHVYLRDSAGNMIGVGVATANQLREDVGRVHGCGDYHGYSTTMPTDVVGNYHVMVALIDSGSDNPTWCDGGDVTITKPQVSPTGNLEAYHGGVNKVAIAGWAHDEDDTSKAIEIHLYIDGKAGEGGKCIGITKTGDKRTDGTYTGFYLSASIDVPTGMHNIYVYAINLEGTGGNHTIIGEATVFVGKPVNLGDNFDAMITNPNSGKYVTASVNNDNVILYDASAYATKRVWKFSRNNDGSYRITSYYNSKCIDVGGSGDNIYTWSANNNDTQKWYIVQIGSYYKLMSAHFNSRCMDVAGAGTDNRTNIQIFDINETAAQTFTIDKLNDTTIPQIKDVKISDITKDGYKVTITVSDNIGIQKVAVPTWTQANGQDDLFAEWDKTALATQTGDNTWTYNVKVSDHNNERGVYYTDVYAWDFSGNSDAWRGENQKRTTIKVGMYNLTVDPSGGTMKDESGNQTTKAVKITKNQLIYNGSNYYSLTWTIPTRVGYSFTGFYSEPTGGTKIYGADGKCVNEGKYFKNNLYQQTADLTVYAQWKAESVAGDVDADGELSVSDLVLLQKWILGVPDTNLANWENADLCKDGVLDVFDLCLMRKMLVKLK